MEEIGAGKVIQCPHCGTTVRLEHVQVNSAREIARGLGLMEGIYIVGPNPFFLWFAKCPACSRAVVQVADNEGRRLVVPRTASRRAIHDDVPAHIRQDLIEAAIVLDSSPKASAALSRRCLQSLLVAQGAKKEKLVEQLEEIAPTLPSYVAPFVDHVRHLGNLSAHPKRSFATGEIVDVEPDEAEWMLELIEELLDHYYAKPADAKARAARIEGKRADAKNLRLHTMQ